MIHINSPGSPARQLLWHWQHALAGCAGKIALDVAVAEASNDLNYELADLIDWHLLTFNRRTPAFRRLAITSRRIRVP